MYRTIDASFWTDAKVRKLKPEGRLLFLYLITNPHTHVSGIYYLPLLIAQHETGLTQKSIESAIKTLTSCGLCLFDLPNELVWVVRMFRFQGSGPKNTLSAAHHLSKDVHNSFLVSEFLKVYPDVAAHIKNRVPIGYPAQVGDATPDSPFPIPEPENGEQIPDSEIRTAYGEFGHVRLTVLEHEKLMAKLNGNLNRLIDRLDRWGEEEPAKFKKKKSHYATLLNWAERDGGNGNGKPRQSGFETRGERTARINRETFEQVDKLLS